MSRHFHGVSHGRLHIDFPDTSLTEGELLYLNIDLLSAMLKGIDKVGFPRLYATIEQKLADLKSEAETADDLEWLEPSELAPVMTFNGEADEVRLYHSDNGMGNIPF